MQPVFLNSQLDVAVWSGFGKPIGTMKKLRRHSWAQLTSDGSDLLRCKIQAVKPTQAFKLQASSCA